MQISYGGIGVSLDGQRSGLEAASGVNQARPSARTGSSQIVDGGDSITFSTTAALLSHSLSESEASNVKVQQINSAVADGTYRVNADRLASAIIHTMLQTNPE